MSGRTPDRQPGLRAAYRAAQAHLVAYEAAPESQTRDAVLAASREIARNVQAGVVDTAPPDITILRSVPPASRAADPAARFATSPMLPSGPPAETSFLLTDDDDGEAIEPASSAPGVRPSTTTSSGNGARPREEPSSTQVIPGAAAPPLPAPPLAGGAEDSAFLDLHEEPSITGTVAAAATSLPAPLPAGDVEDSGFLDLADTLPGEFAPDAVPDDV
ncbi:MAG TPA: hypothetical protein VH328_14925, partial [Burkholderiaceae bacterium]|nr:hypothetical protein [Burkholderiaceae bacterium]